MTATVYLEHNNGGKIILYNYNGKWWYENIDSDGFYGDVNIYASNEDGEALTDETIAAELARQYTKWESLDSCFSMKRANIMYRNMITWTLKI